MSSAAAAVAEDAKQRLANAFEEAFGGYPADVEVQPQVVRGQTGATLVQAAGRDGSCW